MNVEVERCSHIGVTEDDTDRLIVAAALDTSGGKGMAQSVKHYGRYLQSTQQPGECLAVSARLFRCHPCANNVDIPLLLPAHLSERVKQRSGDWDFPY